MTGKLRSITVAVVSFGAVISFGSVSGTSPGVALLANTILVMGGNSNPNGDTMEYELSGCHLSDCSSWPPGYISGAAGTRYPDYTFTKVTWSAQTPFTTGSNGMLYDTSQQEGVDRFFEAVEALDYVEGDKVVAVGYSGSANVMTKALRELAKAKANGDNTVGGVQAPVPSGDDLSFVLFGNPNRPNGGLFSRFAGAYLPPPVGVSFDGVAPDGSDYHVTDISWQWDPASDFPNYPLNLISLLNTAVGFYTLHSVYYPADPTDESTIVQDVTYGNTRYLLLKPDHLPILAPLYLLKVPQPVIDLVRPTMEYLVELGYNRNINPGTPTPAEWVRLTNDPLTVVDGFFETVDQGRDALASHLAPQNVAPVDETASQTTESVDTNAGVVAHSAVSSQTYVAPTGPRFRGLAPVKPTEEQVTNPLKPEDERTVKDVDADDGNTDTKDRDDGVANDPDSSVETNPGSTTGSSNPTSGGEDGTGTGSATSTVKESPGNDVAA